MEINDLGIIFTLVILTVLVISLPALADNPVRTALGLALTLFLPGYSLISALFPGKKELGGIERIALGFGLSITVVPVIGFILNYTPFGVTQESVLYSVAAFTLIFAILTYSRRMSLEDEEFKVSFDLTIKVPENKADRVLTAIFCFAIVLSVATLVYVISTPKQGDKFTEFYILGPEGIAGNYPTDLKTGQNGTVIIGVVNHEYQTVNYSLKVLFNGTGVYGKNILLENNQIYEKDYAFKAGRKGISELEFLLYKDGMSDVYKSLHLWVNAS